MLLLDYFFHLLPAGFLISGFILAPGSDPFLRSSQQEGPEEGANTPAAARVPALAALEEAAEEIAAWKSVGIEFQSEQGARPKDIQGNMGARDLRHRMRRIKLRRHALDLSTRRLRRNASPSRGLGQSWIGILCIGGTIVLSAVILIKRGCLI